MTMIADSYYHRVLRVAALTAALVLLFVSGVLSPATEVVTRNTALQVANTVSMFASVPATEINTLNTALEEKSRQIAEREVAVTLKENKTEGTDTATIVLSMLVFVLIVLMVINYTLDFARMRTMRSFQNQNEKMA